MGIDHEHLRSLLCELGAAIRDQVCQHRDDHGVAPLASVVGRVTADVVYAVDRVSEEAVLDWMTRHWPPDEPVRLVMEGVEDHTLVTVPSTARPDEVGWLCIVDPVDGTRSLMHDKRSAWALAAVAPARVGDDGRPGARLGDVVVAAMTEIPTAKQGRADQLSAIRGLGPGGVVGRRVDLRDGSDEPIVVTPSPATGFEHGFCSFSRFFPDGKALLAAIEQDLWDALLPMGDEPRAVFEDQYLCSGGQLHEVATGRDRMVVDLRPLVADHLGLTGAYVAHPYDVCTALVLTEAGGVFEDPMGGPVDVPLDTTSPVAFAAYASPALAERVRPALRAAVAEVLG